MEGLSMCIKLINSHLPCEKEGKNKSDIGFNFSLSRTNKNPVNDSTHEVSKPTATGHIGAAVGYTLESH